MNFIQLSLVPKPFPSGGEKYRFNLLSSLEWQIHVA